MINIALICVLLWFAWAIISDWWREWKTNQNLRSCDLKIDLINMVYLLGLADMEDALEMRDRLWKRYYDNNR